MVVVLLMLSACAGRDVWVQKAEITPVSYRLPSETLGRNIGRLRRLVLVPGVFEANFEGEDDPERARGALKWALSLGADYLRGERGYEADVLASDPKGDGAQPVVLDEPLRACIRTLRAWSTESSRGDTPPATVTSCVKKIADPYAADGVVVLDGFIGSDSEWRVILVFLTASLSWPLLMWQFDLELDAQIFETFSGKIVWRGSFNREAAEEKDIDMYEAVRTLFEPLEHAVPKVLIQ